MVQHTQAIILVFIGLVYLTLSAPITLAPGAWSKDSSSDISSSFEYKSVGNVVQFEVVRTSTLNKTSTLPTVITFVIRASTTGKVWPQNSDIQIVGPNGTEVGDTYTVEVAAITTRSFTYAVRACEGTCETNSLRKCWINDTVSGVFCNGNGACKLDHGICSCDFIDWKSEMEKLPSYLQGVVKLLGEADSFINRFITDQCHAPLDPETVVDYLSHYFLVMCIGAGFGALVLIGLIVGLCFCCGCCKCKKGPLTGVYQPVDRFEADELEGFN